MLHASLKFMKPFLKRKFRIKENKTFAAPGGYMLDMDIYLCIRLENYVRH